MALRLQNYPLLVCCMAALLAGCGGGGSTSSTPSSGGTTSTSSCVYNIHMSDSSGDPIVNVYASYGAGATTMPVEAVFKFTGAPNGSLTYCGSAPLISSSGGSFTYRTSYVTTGEVASDSRTA